ncbi:hypothetical protein EOA16_10315 [Mesorhizobium sp. M7A.F.Ca.US.008.03.1.1]|nr:hypothetical protein EOA16_10315 [Mesorhizobium sp. M7A.F.Ca.US.008.03.1.1]
MLTMKRLVRTAALVLLAGITQAHADARRGAFSNALWYSSKCPAYELDPQKAMEIAVSVGLPNTPSSIIVTANEGESSFLSNVVPFAGHPDRAQLSYEECTNAYSLFGPEGTVIKGILRLRSGD